MRSLSIRPPWRQYGMLMLIIPMGFVFGLLCFLLILIESVFRIFVFAGLGLCGLGVVVSDRLRKSPFHIIPK
jgi:hypothetical protein